MVNKDALFEWQDGLLQLPEPSWFSLTIVSPVSGFPRSWPWSPRRAPRPRVCVLGSVVIIDELEQAQ